MGFDLTDCGINKNGVDGISYKGTESYDAITTFQRLVGAEATGKVDASLLSKMDKAVSGGWKVNGNKPLDPSLVVSNNIGIKDSIKSMWPTITEKVSSEFREDRGINPKKAAPVTNSIGKLYAQDGTVASNKRVILSNGSQDSIIEVQGNNGSSSQGTGKINYNPDGNVTNTNHDEPVVPILSNKEGERGADAYNNVIDQFEVETNPRYTPGPNDHPTYCNYYARDVMKAMGVTLPDGGCTSINNWFHSPAGSNAGWNEVTAEEAQKYANNGYPTIAINPGHIAVVAPSPNPDDGMVYVSQAGAHDYITRLSPINGVWSRSEQKYYFYHK